MYHSIDANERRGMKLPRRAVLVRVLLALSVLGALVMASTASATPVEGPEGEAFYTRAENTSDDQKRRTDPVPPGDAQPQRDASRATKPGK